MGRLFCLLLYGCWLVCPAKEELISCQSLFQSLPLGHCLLIQTKTSESSAKQSCSLNTTAFVPCLLLYLCSAGLVVEENFLVHVHLIFAFLSINCSLSRWISKLVVLVLAEVHQILDRHPLCLG